ncbi:MAG: tetratricopeptide repeat protein [Arcobacteraceae bacterium]
MKKILITLIAILGMSIYSYANDFDKGMKAYIENNYTQALPFLQKACDGGKAEGCNNLGAMYANGQGVRQDHFKAVELYAKACNYGNPIGCNNLGVSYAKGQGVKQDYRKAKEFFGKACDGRNADGCTNYVRVSEMGY